MTGALADAISEHRDGAVLAVTVVPRSGVTAIDRVEATALRIRVAAPPIDGAANAALVRYLTEELGIPRGNVRILAGETGRRKRVLFVTLTAEDLARRLGSKLPTDEKASLSQPWERGGRPLGRE